MVYSYLQNVFEKKFATINIQGISLDMHREAQYVVV
jgi:hypothetical protein